MVLDSVLLLGQCIVTALTWPVFIITCLILKKDELSILSVAFYLLDIVVTHTDVAFFAFGIIMQFMLHIMYSTVIKRAMRRGFSPYPITGLNLTSGGGVLSLLLKASCMRTSVGYFLSVTRSKTTARTPRIKRFCPSRLRCHTMTMSSRNEETSDGSVSRHAISLETFVAAATVS